MARTPDDGPTAGHEASPTEQAYGAAASFIRSLSTLAGHARRLETCRSSSDDWRRYAFTYAHGFTAWFDLTCLLTPAVRDAARRVYPPGSPSIKLGKTRARPTVIEAVADELGVYFRNVLYQDRRCPLDPNCEKVAEEAKAQATARQVAQGKPAEPFGWGDDFDELMKDETRAAVRERLGINTLGDAWVLMAREWESQNPERADAKLGMLRCGSIDFEDLQTQLDREARAVLALETDPEPATIAVPADTLVKLEAALATLLVDPRAEKKHASPGRRPKRTDADKVRDEGKIAAHLVQHPDTTRDEIAETTGIAAAHVSNSIVWKAHKVRQKEARKANRARAVGGVGDPSVDRYGGDEYED